MPRIGGVRSSRDCAWQRGSCEEENLTAGFILFCPSMLKLREEFDQGLDVFLDEHQSVHDVAALLKEFLRDMPDPLVPRELYGAFLSTACECRAVGALPAQPTHPLRLREGKRGVSFRRSYRLRARSQHSPGGHAGAVCAAPKGSFENPLSGPRCPPYFGQLSF